MKSFRNLLLVAVVLLAACTEKHSSSLPTVSTGQYVVYVGTLSATCSGYVERDGGSAVVERGVCYVRGTEIPTVANTCISGGSGKGSFSCALTNLVENENYSYRAYATNSKGTAYGDVVTFKTDQDGSGGPQTPDVSPDDPEIPEGDQPGGEVSAELRAILGTYILTGECGSWMNFEEDPETVNWSGIRIYPNSAYGEMGVTVEGLYEGDAKYGAFGQYDPTTKQLTLLEGTSTGKEFSYPMQEYENGDYVWHTYDVIAKFQPLDYSPCSQCGVWTGWSVPTVNISQIVFDFTEANTLTLGKLPDEEYLYQTYEFELYSGSSHITHTNQVKKVVLTRISGAY